MFNVSGPSLHSCMCIRTYMRNLVEFAEDLTLESLSFHLQTITECLILLMLTIIKCLLLFMFRVLKLNGEKCYHVQWQFTSPSILKSKDTSPLVAENKIEGAYV